MAWIRHTYEWSGLTLWYCPIIFQVKFEVFPVYGMKSCGGRDIAPLIIENWWRWVRCFGRKSPRFPLSRKWKWVGRTAGSDVSLEMKICCPCRELNHDYALIQPVIWSLYPLRCLGSHFPRCLKNVLEIFSVWGGIWSRDITTVLWNLVSVRSVFLCLEYYAWGCINGVEVKFYEVKGCGLKWCFEIYASSTSPAWENVLVT